MPDFSKEKSNKIQVWFKRGNNHNIKVQFIEDPLLRTQALFGSWQIGKKDVQTERGNNSTPKISNIFHNPGVQNGFYVISRINKNKSSK
jgi:hypothetical protein